MAFSLTNLASEKADLSSHVDDEDLFEIGIGRLFSDLGRIAQDLAVSLIKQAEQVIALGIKDAVRAWPLRLILGVQLHVVGAMFPGAGLRVDQACR